MSLKLNIKKLHDFRILNNCILIFSCMVFLTSCVTRKVKVTEVSFQESVPVVTESKIKRTIKDTDLKNSQDDKSLKKRIIVLPFIDTSKELNVDLSERLQNARNKFIDKLNLNHDLIALDSAGLSLDLTKAIKNSQYNLVEIAKASQNSGASLLMEIRLIDLRFKKSSELFSKKNLNQVDLNKKMASFEVVTQIRISSIRTSQELFNTVKTVTIEEENTSLPENTNSDLFFQRNPELVELLIKDALLDYLPRISEAVNQVLWEGRIAALHADKIYLNVGKITGVQIGDILKVVETGNEIYDPEMGYHIGKIPGRVKGTLEVVGFFGQDGAISIIHSGAGFKENDRIELYE